MLRWEKCKEEKLGLYVKNLFGKYLDRCIIYCDKLYGH